MSVVFEAGYTLPGGDEPLTHARIAHSGNWLSGGSALASTTDSDFFADGPLTSLTYEKWKPTVPVELVTFPQELDNAAWTKTGSTIAVDNATVPGAGSAYADRVNEDTSTGLHSVVSNSFNVVEGVTYRFSGTFKSEGRDFLQYNVPDSRFGVSSHIRVDLSTGSVYQSLGATTQNETVTDLGSGWWRVSFEITCTSSGSTSLNIDIGSASATFSYTGDGASGIVMTDISAEAINSWEYNHGSTAECDYCIIAAHTFGTDGATFKIQYENGGWVDLCAATSPTTDEPIMIIFEPQTRQRWRVNISEGTPEAGVIKFGKALQMERPLYGEYTPVNLARKTDLRSSYSESGEFLGRTKLRTYSEFQIAWRMLSRSWVDANWLPAIKQFETEPFVLAPDPSTFDEVAFCQTTGPVPAMQQGANGYLSAQLSVRARGYD